MGSRHKTPPSYPPPKSSAQSSQLSNPFYSQLGNPFYGPLGNQLGNQPGSMTPNWHSAYNNALQQAQQNLAASNNAHWSEPRYMGKPVWVWLLWAGYVNYCAGPGEVDMDAVVTALDQIAKSQPDKWEAFAAAQRVQGRNLWDTEVTSP